MRLEITATVAILGALSLAACMMGPDYKRPESAPAEAWRLAPASAESIANLPWWEVLRDPSLQGLIRTALADVSADAISPKIAELKSPLNTESQCLFTDHSDGGGTDAAKGGLYGDSGIGGTRTLSLRHRQTGRRTSADGASGP